ncbi:MAG: type II toxin-antitoxin system VapC family toxin [Thermodesulfobacteriota bacterium]
MNYVIDTNVISELIARRPNRKVVEWLDDLDPDTIFLTVITIGEICKGIEKLPRSRRRESLRSWLETDLIFRFQGRILDIATDVMLVWGELTARLERQGKTIPAIDSLIAALVLERNYCLVTRNERDFLHTGVTLINPWKDA